MSYIKRYLEDMIYLEADRRGIDPGTAIDIWFECDADFDLYVKKLDEHIELTKEPASN